jgi:uncharacterized protein
MKIGVLSDTHLSENTGMFHAVKQALRNSRTLHDLDKLLQRHFQDVALILHAGDFVDLSVLERLRTLAPVEAVQGNMDSTEIRAQLPTRKIIEVEGIRVGLTHGDGAPQGIVSRVLAYFQDDRLDAVVFGHSHTPINERHNGILCFNPGSPTDRIFAPYNSLGILEITKKTITGTLIRL